MDDATRIDIVDQLNEIVIELAPDVTLRSMYGGTVIELRKGDPKSRVGGIYTYANHVSLELSQGVFLMILKAFLREQGSLGVMSKYMN